MTHPKATSKVEREDLDVRVRRLRILAEDQIEREGEVASFPIRVGLLRDLLEALTTPPAPVEQTRDLCAGECRGHSLGHPDEWEPEPGSRDAPVVRGDDVERVADAMKLAEDKFRYGIRDETALYHNDTQRELYHLRARAAIAALSTNHADKDEAWQPIETAPKDGSFILLAGSNFDGGQAVVQWDDGFDNWTLDDGKNPEIVLRHESKLTHWRKLPEGPKAMRSTLFDGEDRALEQRAAPATPPT